MLVKELYSQVAKLGFEDSLDDGARFYQAAKRALFQVALVRPETRVCLLNHKPLDNMIADIGALDVKEDIIVPASLAKSYYFEVNGNGRAQIEYFDGESGWQLIGSPIDLASNHHEFKAYRGFINSSLSDVRLRFLKGDYLYTIRNVALYEYKFSDKSEEIPAFEEFSRYDIKTIVSDFWSFESPAIKADKNILRFNTKYEIESDSVILLPRDAAGVYKVYYKHRPDDIDTRTSPENSDALIDLDAELSALLPLLVASYIWIDEEPEKAQYYLTLYREAVINIERKTKDITPIQITTNGWG